MSELASQPDPYDVYIPPSITGTHKDKCGRTVIEVRACSGEDVSRITAGTTEAGNVTEVHTHVGPNRWEISFVDNDDL
ncbi:MAG: hypothetical protein EHM40_02950 [Chloroflexi bacterium]|nr:MAG: hypothetical protein EHM40_02950 [Chloroflexota bacterium]